MKETPTIAVVMCTYNGERFLREQMDSILAQTYPIAEIIVQDDGSTDNTVNILRQYAERVPQMQIHVNEKNLGFNRNFHTACLRATADYIAISDQDDVWMPNKLERQIEAIGPCNICYSTHLRGRDMATAHTVAPRCNLEAMLFTGIAGHTMIARRDFIQRPESWTNDRIVYDWSLALNAYFFRQPNAIVRVTNRSTGTARTMARRRCCKTLRCVASRNAPHGNLTCMVCATIALCSASPTGIWCITLLPPTPRAMPPWPCLTAWLH